MLEMESFLLWIECETESSRFEIHKAASDKGKRTQEALDNDDEEIRN